MRSFTKRIVSIFLAAAVLLSLVSVLYAGQEMPESDVITAMTDYPETEQASEEMYYETDTGSVTTEPEPANEESETVSEEPETVSEETGQVSEEPETTLLPEAAEFQQETVSETMIVTEQESISETLQTSETQSAHETSGTQAADAETETGTETGNEEESTEEKSEETNLLRIRIPRGKGTVTVLDSGEEYSISTDEAVSADKNADELCVQLVPEHLVTVKIESARNYEIDNIHLRYETPEQSSDEAGTVPEIKEQDFEEADKQKTYELMLEYNMEDQILEVCFAEADPYYLGEDFDYSRFDNINLSSRRLIVADAAEDIFIDDGSLISGYEGVYLLQYSSEETALKAYAYYYTNAGFVEADTGVMIAGCDAPEYKAAEISSPVIEFSGEIEDPEAGITEGSAAETVDTDTVMTESENPLSELEDAVYNSTYQPVDIAVIDTGANGADESVSMIGEDTYDYNGHGTAMLGYIREYAPDARILSVKALGDDGTGDISAVYAAIQYAAERGASIINMSISALAGPDSALIEKAVDDAVNMGITVVGAAGNNNSDAGYYIPGRIRSACIIGACNIAGTKTENSNYGLTVDYAMTAGSTSEAAARFSGWLAYNGRDAIQEALRAGRIFRNSSTIGSSDAPEGTEDLFNIAAVPSGYTFVDLPLPPKQYHTYVDHYEDEGGFSFPVLAHDDIPWSAYLEPFQNLSGKLYDYNDAAHPTPDTDIYSTGRDYRNIAEIKIYDSRFYSFTNDQGVVVIGVHQDDIERTCPKIHLTDEYGWNLEYDKVNRKKTSTFNSTEFEHPFDIILRGAAVDPYGRELDLTISFDRVRSVKHGSISSYGIFPGTVYSPTDGGSRSSWWAPLWGQYTTPAAYNGTNFIAGILQSEIWSCAAPLYNTSVTPEIEGNQFGGMNKISLSWKYSDGTAFNGNVDYAFKDIDSSQDGFLFIPSSQGRPSDHIGFQETVSLNSGWTGVYKQVPNSDFQLYTINNNASYLCKVSDNDTFKTGFVASAKGDAPAQLTWTGSWCGTIIYNLFSNNKGAVRVEKSSSDASVKKSLAGAKFGIYTSSDCSAASLVDTIITDADGIAATESFSLSPKTYYVREISAPEGYKLNTNTFTAAVTSGNITVVSVKEDPIPPVGSIQILKEIDPSGLGSAAVNAVRADSAYSVAGAQYTVYTDSACTSRYGSALLTIAADDPTGMKGSSNVIQDVPLGTYYIKETKAGKNLALDASVYTVSLTAANCAATQRPASVSRDKPELGSITLTKVSASPGITYANSCYSLKGAVYGIYTNSECTAQFTTCTTDDSGRFTAENLPYGTYYVKEITAPGGYGPDTSIYKVQLSPSARTAAVNSKEPVLAFPVSVLICKQDSVSGKTSPQGGGSFTGAEYTVRYYMNEDWKGSPARTWVIVTDEHGIARLDSKSIKSGSDALYITADEKAVIPVGSFTIQETKAPVGYKVDDTVYRYKVSGSGISYKNAKPAEIIPVATDPLLDSARGMTGRETAVYGGVKIQKTDAERDGAYPQGDASLEGAQFTIYNDSVNPVWADGADHARGEAVMTIITDAAGIAGTQADALPYGEYIIRETKAPKGYLPDPDWSMSFAIREDGAVIDKTDDKVQDTPVRGGVKFQKVDAETLESIAQGAGTLEGAEISIYNISNAPVMVDGALYDSEPDPDPDTLRTNGKPVKTVKTDPSGTAQTGSVDLPYGTYVAIETKASEGYELNENWSVVFQIRQNGMMADTASDDADAKSGWITNTSGLLAEQVIRRDFEFLKVDIDGRPMSNTAFLITRYDRSGNEAESHVFVTDSNGWYKSAQKDKKEGLNSLDNCVSEGWFVKNGEHADPVSSDAYAAVRFGSENTELNDGALVYGTYRITELRTPSNEQRHETLQFTRDAITVTESSEEPLFLGVMVNVEVSLSTEVRDSVLGLKMTRIGEAVEVEDEITYDHLDAGNEYILRVDYRDAVTGISAGTSEMRFTPEQTSRNVNTSGVGKVTVKGTINTSGYKGKGGKISACTQLYQVYSNEGKSYEMLIRTHNEDLTDTDETLYIPSVKTQALDAATGDHQGAYSEEEAITDTVSVTGIAPGCNYRLKAIAVRNSDKAELGSCELSFSSGRNITDVQRSMPEIILDSRELAGDSVTIMEYLYYLEEDEQGNVSELLVGEHSDPEDPDQTIWYAAADTLALTPEGLHAAQISDEIKITDTVDLRGIAAGREYVLEGVLTDADTGKKLLDDNGKEISVKEEFTADADEIQKQLEFVFTLTKAVREKDAPVKAVVFADLYHRDVLVGSYEDAEDKDETVIIVPERYKKYSDPEMTQETTVRENDVIGYTISWSQTEKENARVWLRDTLSEGLEYVEGSARTEAGEAFEPVISGNVLLWEMKDVPAGAYGRISYDVRVTHNIKTHPLVNNNYETAIEDPDRWVHINSLENPGIPDKEYSNDLLKADVPVLSENAVVYEGKSIEYSLVWINRFTEKTTVELKDTLSAGLEYNKGSADTEPSDIIINEDGTTVLYWRIEALPHEWGKISYTVTVNTGKLEKKAVYMVNNDYDIRITKTDETPDRSGWQDIRTLRNPVPHYIIEKNRITDAPEKGSEGKYGFARGDVIEYEAVITNDGSTSMVFDISDSFESEGVFEGLKITDISGKDVQIILLKQAQAKILVKAGAQARISYQTQTAMSAGEYLSSSARDDRNETEDGYLNTAGAFNAQASYTDTEGRMVTLSEEGITVTQANAKPLMYAVKIPDLAGKKDTANTPVQVPLPNFSISKDRVSEAPAKKGDGNRYGFREGDRIIYDVTAINTGELDLELTVCDGFAPEIAGYFRDLKILNVNGKELERKGDTSVRLKLPKGEKAVVRFEAYAASGAAELLSDSVSDKTRELIRNMGVQETGKIMSDPSSDLLGYLNIARGMNAAAVYETNDGKTVEIHGTADEDYPGKTRIISPDGSETLIDSSEDYLKGVSERFDAAHTPVQGPDVPQDSPEKPESKNPLPENNQQVKTGDENNAFIWLVLAAGALFMIAVAVTIYAVRKRR